MSESSPTPGNRERGFVKVYRSAFDEGDPFWGEKRARTSWEARLDLLRMAHYEAEPWSAPVAGGVVEVRRGQVLTSILGLSDRWGWSRGKVRRFLNGLVKLGTIKLECGLGVNETRTADGHRNGQGDGQADAAPFLLLTFCNFEHYNGGPAKGAAEDGHPGGHRDETETDTGRTQPIKKESKKKPDRALVPDTDKGKRDVKEWFPGSTVRQ